MRLQSLLAYGNVGSYPCCLQSLFNRIRWKRRIRAYKRSKHTINNSSIACMIMLTAISRRYLVSQRQISIIISRWVRMRPLSAIITLERHRSPLPPLPRFPRPLLHHLHNPLFQLHCLHLRQRKATNKPGHVTTSVVSSASS